MLIQLTAAFIMQISYVSQAVFVTEWTFVWDMFGLLFHNLRLYQVILHLVTMTFSIQAIQLYKVTRLNSLKSFEAVIPGQVNAGPLQMYMDDDQKSDDKFIRSVKRRFGASERGRTITSGFARASKQTVVDRIREKTMELKLR